MTLTVEQVGLPRRALRLAQFTVAYNLAEGIASVVLGILAGLVSVIGFGFDSGIESLSAVLVGIRFAARLRGGEADERAERRTLRVVAITFFALAAYVVIAGIRDLIVGERPETSPGSIVVLVLSIIVMPLLAWAKTRVGRALGDRLILADAAETRVCVLLSIRERDWQKFVAYAASLMLYAAYFGWHWWMVSSQLGPMDRAYGEGWVAFGGLDFVLATAGFNGLWALGPDWLPAVLLPLGLLGLWAWPKGRGLAAVGVYLAAFLVIGKPFNAYWGAVYAPVLMLGLGWVWPAVVAAFERKAPSPQLR